MKMPAGHQSHPTWTGQLSSLREARLLLCPRLGRGGRGAGSVASSIHQQAEQSAQPYPGSPQATSAWLVSSHAAHCPCTPGSQAPQQVPQALQQPSAGQRECTAHPTGASHSTRATVRKPTRDARFQHGEASGIKQEPKDTWPGKGLRMW